MRLRQNFNIVLMKNAGNGFKPIDSLQNLTQTLTQTHTQTLRVNKPLQFKVLWKTEVRRQQHPEGGSSDSDKSEILICSDFY